MRSITPSRFSASALAIALAATLSLSAPALAQDEGDYEDKAESRSGITGGAAAASERARQKREARRAEQQAAAATPAEYPQSTRVEPESRASARGSARLKTMMEAYEAKDAAKTRSLADEVIGDARSNPYERAFAARLAAYAAYEAGDSAAAKALLTQAIDLNGLGNNDHFGAMFMLAQLQVQDEQYAESLVTLDRFLAESKSADPEHLVLKGNALYRTGKYAEAVAVLRQAIAASPQPRADWQGLLMGALAESGDTAEAARVAAQVAASSPGDRRAQMNLVAMYQQAGKDAEAIAVLERLRAAGQLTEERDYRLLFSLYANTENKEAQSIAVINEGLQKGVLKQDFNTLIALAQAYYFSEQVPQAIEAYRKAAPLDDDGETWLNLAKVLWQADRMGEAKDAARQAKAKGLRNPAEADRVLAQPGK